MDQLRTRGSGVRIAPGAPFRYEAGHFLQGSAHFHFRGCFVEDGRFAGHANAGGAHQNFGHQQTGQLLPVIPAWVRQQIPQVLTRISLPPSLSLFDSCLRRLPSVTTHPFPPWLPRYRAFPSHLRACRQPPPRRAFRRPSGVNGRTA